MSQTFQVKPQLLFQVKPQLPNLLHVIVYNDHVSKEQMDQNVMDWATFMKIGMSLLNDIISHSNQIRVASSTCFFWHCVSSKTCFKRKIQGIIASFSSNHILIMQVVTCLSMSCNGG